MLVGCLVAGSLAALALCSNVILRTAWHHHRASIFTCTQCTKLLLYAAFGLGNGGLQDWSPALCPLWAGLVHWAVLAVLFWLCVESANLYKILRQALCPVDHPRAPCALFRKAIVAWGRSACDLVSFPGLPTMIVALQYLPYMDVSSLSPSSQTGPHSRCAPGGTLAFYLLPGLALLVLDSALFCAVWLTYNRRSQAGQDYACFVRRESAVNFARKFMVQVPHLQSASCSVSRGRSSCCCRTSRASPPRCSPTRPRRTSR